MTCGNGFELLGGMSLKEDRQGRDSNDEDGGVEKVKALGTNGEMSGSSARVVWIVVDGGKVRARLVSNVVAIVVLLLLGVKELALEAIEYDDQDE
ncbi:hypothetical protein Tco_0703304 [Tanacetum coccineum]|uniref:Uncharacterized protein n=1 Tax=Tanacetum coccineum TaxID=301880 RepID=A0ABQ4Y007_9ASTR